MDTDQIKARLCDNILEMMSGKTFGKRVAEEIVGGRTKLRRLMEAGKVRFSKNNTAQNGKWQVNAGDVLRHCRKVI